MSVGQDYSIYGNRITYSQELMEARTVRDVRLAIGNPELVVNILINVAEDSLGYELFKQDVKRFVNLRRLVVFNPDITQDIAFDLDLSHLTKLEYLRIEGLVCDDDIKGLKELKDLKFLTISGAGLKSFPDAVLSLHDVEVLDLSVNFISVLPNAIKDMKRVKELDISNNAFVDIPESIARMDSLFYLDFNNAETGIGETHEKFGNNVLNNYPETIINMPSLLSLSLFSVAVTPEMRKRIKQNKPRKLKVQY